MPAGKLTAMAVSKAKLPGMYGDGGGLWLQVVGSAGKSWIFRFTLGGKARAMGLGSAATFSLAEARDRALVCRKLVADGIDPIEARKSERVQQALEAAKALTFSQCATAYIEAHKAGWRDRRHASQWQQTLDDYVKPVFGSLPVAHVDTALVMRALEPIWIEKTVTAAKVRGRIEAVLDWATVRGYRQGENPARWKGHLANLLPKRTKVSKVEHHRALPFSKVPGFVKALVDQPGVAATAITFTILTAARTGETIGARWSELDLGAKVWTIPAERMKAGAEHRVPLCAQALAIVQKLAATKTGPFVFPGTKHGKPLSKTAMMKTVERMKRIDVTVHGFRSSFRDWAAERTNFPKEVAEAALAHTIENKVEAAYRRGDLFEKRRRLMDAWGAYVERGEAKGGAQIIGLSRTRGGR